MATADVLLLIVDYHFINANAVLDRKQSGVLSHEFCRCIVLYPLRSPLPFNPLRRFSSFHALTIIEDYSAERELIGNMNIHP